MMPRSPRRAVTGQPARRQRRGRLRRLDSYIFGQILGPFLFFVLVFTGVIWLGFSLKVIDTAVNSSRSARVFLELTLLLLPTVLSIVLPLATFAATLFAVNRLLVDSEIVAMFASGLNGNALLRPIMLFSTLVMAVVFALTLYVVPTAQHRLKTRINVVKSDVASAFLREGQFLSPVRGITVYLRATSRPGEILGIFVQDERDPDEITTYSAERAVLVSDEKGTRLVMFDGVVQIAKRHEADSVSILRFTQFAFDLTQLAQRARHRKLKPSELYLPELLTIDKARAAPRPLGAYRAEAHEALSGPLYALALPLIAIAFLISMGFRRKGFVGRIVLAAAAAAVLRLVGLAMKGATTGTAALWPAMYVPPLVGIVAALWMLAGRPLPWRPRPAAERRGGPAL